MRLHSQLFKANSI